MDLGAVEDGERPVIIPLLVGGYAAVRYAVRDFQSTPYDALFVRHGQANGVDPNLLRAIAKQESNYRPEVVSGRVLSSAGAIGLMQIMPAVARALGYTPDDMKDPEKAVRAATALLVQMRQGLTHKARYTLRELIAAYNAGVPNVLKRGELAAQVGYVAGVFGHYVAYSAAGLVYGRP